MRSVALAVIAGLMFWAWVGSVFAAWPFDHFCGLVSVPLAVMFGMLLTVAINQKARETPQ